MTNLNGDGIHQTFYDSATLLDICTADEYRENALPNAKHIPLSVLPAMASEQMDKDEPVLIYCHSGGRAIIAEKILSGLGFTDITNISSVPHHRHCH
ncbi:MAG: rhodanese-like domain-containing protein [Proteobacteria bacterium]|nr:rhodanese-like domain-containing protein [Pseudomonadota bacterium]